MPTLRNSDSLSVRAAVRRLYDYARAYPSDDPLDPITRTLKFRVRTDERLKRELNKHFDAAARFRQSIMAELEKMFDERTEDFFAMVQSGASKPYEGKSSCLNWIVSKFASRQTDAPRTLASAVLVELSGNLKSFATRRDNVVAEMQNTLASNAAKWNKQIPSLTKELGISDVPPPPPVIAEERPTDKQIEDYNEWVARARMWCNLVFIQKHKLTRDEAAMPARLKHLPGFPGSQRYLERVALADALIKLREAAEQIVDRNIGRYAQLTDHEWQAILERFPAPTSDKEGPKSVRATTGRRIHALLRDNPGMAREALAREIVAGMMRGADKITKHLRGNSTNDRQATVKLLNLYNTASVFALEPLRVRFDYAKLFSEDTPRRNAYGKARGAMHDASDMSEAIQITGFSIAPNGVARYNGFLAYRRNTMGDDWAFATQLAGGHPMRIAPDDATDPRRDLTPWIAFGSTGGSRQKALFTPKKVVRNRLWVSKKDPTLILPLQLGKRQGREYLWNFDRGLKDKDDFTLANGRVLRICPRGRTDLAQFYVVVTLERELPCMAEPPGGKYIGVDRGEAVPASFAIVDSDGRVLEHGDIHPEFRSQQRAFAEEKSRLQSRFGGYNRYLKAKERNRAKALSGEVSRELLSLAAHHMAPIVFERLTSALSTRGGAKQLMSVMQYERMLTAVEQRMAEAACYKAPRTAKFRKNRCGFIMFVGPAYTSSTCSKCGQVHSSRFYDALVDTLARDKSGKWSVQLEGKTLVLASSYSYWSKQKGKMVEVQTAERLEEIMGDRTFAKLPKTKQAAALRVLREALNYRPRRQSPEERSSFRCLRCGHEADADLQAAANIARKAIFMLANPKAAKAEGEEGRRAAEQTWQKWYEAKCKTWS